MLNQDYTLQLMIFYFLLAHCYLLQLTKSYICIHGVLRKAIPHCDDTVTKSCIPVY